MPRVTKRHSHAIQDLDRPLIIDRNKLLQDLLSISDGVERFDGWKMFPFALFGNESGVGHLNFGRIHEHDAGEVAGSKRAIDISGVPLLAKVGQIARVIHMGMAQDRDVNLFWVKWEPAVAGGFLLAMALEEPAFQQQFFAIDLKEIHGTGSGASGAKKVDLHGPTL